MKKTFVAIAVGSLMSVAGFANAAEPMQLTDTQMDNVAAGTFYIQSFAAGDAWAKRGKVSSTSATVLKMKGYGSVASSSTNTAKGFQPRAMSSAGTLIGFGPASVAE